MKKPNANVREPAARASSLGWLGLWLVAAPIFVRAITHSSLFPGWDTDPLVSAGGGFDAGLTPLGSLLVDTLVFLGAGVLMLHARRMGIRPDRATLALAGAGCVPVLYHMLAGATFPGVDLAHARIGLAWASSVAACVAIAHAGRDERMRRTLCALLVGLALMLAIKGAVEFFIEHPRNVETFRASKERILASHGWVAGSSMALGFERRLMQPEASGWFGLSNVYASLAAAMTVLGAGLAVAAARQWQGGRQRAGAWCAAGVLASGAASLYFAQSKGGVIALVAGCSALGTLGLLARVWERSPATRGRITRLGGLIGLCAVVGALGLVAARWLAGDRLSELSILFRGYYAEAALRMLGHAPLWGVGPNGFQDAYALFKNPLSPEDPSSPHIIVLDYLAGLGVLGLAWVCLVLRAAWRAGSGAVVPMVTHETGPSADRSEFRTLMFLPALVTLIGTWVQGALLTPDGALVRVLGLIAACGGAILIARVLRAGISPTLGLAAAGLTLLAHAQIDLAASWGQSCGVVALWIGCAVSSPGGKSVTPVARGSRWFAGAAACLLGLACAGGYAAMSAQRWESHLLAARDELIPVIDINTRLIQLREPASGTVAPRDSMSAIAADVGRLAGTRTPTGPTEFSRAMMAVEERLIPRAVERLMQADGADRADFRARREASRLLTRLADQQNGLGNRKDAEATLRRAAALYAATGDKPGARGASEMFALFLVEERRLAQFGGADAAQSAKAALERAMQLDPYNLEFALRRMRLAVRLGEGDARAFAERCRTLDGYMKHDRAVRGLSDEARKEVDLVLSGSPRPGA